VSGVEDEYAQRLELCNRLTEPAIRAAIADLGCEEGSRGLDAACGVGAHALWLAEAVAPDGCVTGVDLSPAMLARAREHSRTSRWAAAVSFRRGDFQRLPFAAATFDWVWCADALYAGPGGTGAGGAEPVSIVRELARVARPGGFVALAFWSQHRLLPGHPYLEARLNASGAPCLPYTESMVPELHFTCALEWLRAAGLEELRARSYAADVQAPFAAETRQALTDVFNMLWSGAMNDVSPEDRCMFRELTAPDSATCLLDRPHYHGTIIYTVFRGRVPGRQR
jgi:ubiquinone/menaquinone biosynthesis C-methylase UbiE